MNKNCLNEFKKIFLFDTFNFNNININDKQKLFDIFSDKNKYGKIFDKQNELNSEDFLTIKNIKFFYPYNFDIINEEIYHCLISFTKFLNINISDGIFQKTPLIINQEKIITKLMEYNILIIKIGKNNEYIPEMILVFNKYIIRDNCFKKFSEYKFKEIITDEIISFIYNEKNEIIAYKYLLNREKINNDNTKEENIKNYIKIILEFYNFNENIFNKAKRFITLTPTINTEEFFLVNKKWIDEFNYIFSYDEILTTLDNNKEYLENNNAVNIIFNKIGEKLKKYLNNLSENILSTKFNNMNLYKLFDKKFALDNYSNLLYFDTYGIINKPIVDLIKIKNQINKVNCILGDDKILLMIGYKIIIGNLNKNLFITEYIFNLNNKEDLIRLENLIKIKGFDYIYQLLHENKVSIIKNNIKFIAKLENINNIEYDDSNIKNFDDRLKFLLILCIYQLKIKAKNKEEKYLKNVFLLNSEFLSKLDYYSLFNTLNNIIEINNDIMPEIECNKVKEKEILYKLNKFLNIEIINNIGKRLKNINTENFENDFYPKKIKIVLSNQKNMNIYNNFLIVDKNIVTLFKFIFNINNLNLNEINISHISFNQKNIILINDLNINYIYPRKYNK